MAFNPFQAFRKRKKVMFAGLTIMCMFVFVFTAGMSGGGDALDQIARWLGTRGVHKTDLATINGKQFSQDDINRLRRQRELANEFMAMASGMVMNGIEMELRSMPQDKLDKLPQADDTRRRQLEMIRSYLMFRRGPFFPPANPSARSDKSVSDLIDFLVWKDQADRLGIEFSDADVKREISRLLFDRLTPRDSQAVEFTLRQKYKGLTPEMLISAWRDELRVRAAKVVLMGLQYPPSPNSLGSNLIRMPVQVTPDEFWEYFKENRSEIEAALIPVRVEAYLAAVKDVPTEEELLKLYEEGKDRDYVPSAKEPSFKQPRRIQVQWLSGKADSPFYLEAAKQAQGSLDAVTLIAAPIQLNPVLTGTTAAVPTALQLVVDVPLALQYYTETMREFRLRAYAWRRDMEGPFKDSNLFQAANLTAAAAQGLGSHSTGLAPFAAFGSWQLGAYASEVEERSRLAAILATAGTPFQAAYDVYRQAPRDTFLSFDQVKDYLRDKLQQQMTKQVLAANLRTIKKGVEERARKDKSEIAKYLEEETKKFGLKTGKTTELRDLFKSKIADDPGLKYLKDEYLRPPSTDASAKRFGPMFFTDTKPYNFETWHHGAFRGLQEKEDQTWELADEPFYVWKTEDLPAKALPFSDPQVRKDVELAWRWQKARELAKKDAEKLAAEAKGADLRKLKDLAKQSNKEEPFEVVGLAPRLKREAGRREFPVQYIPPEADPNLIPENKVQYIGPDFYKKLLELKDKPAGDTVVVADTPESAYVVGVLLKQNKPDEAEFSRIYQESTGVGQRMNPFFQQFMEERIDKFFNQIMERVRKESRLVPHKENIRRFERDSSEE